MKRFALIIAMMFLALGASAQISGVTTHEAIQTIGNFRMGFCSLKCHNDVYYLTLISTNRAEDSEIVYLGEGKASAIQTLTDLIALNQSMKKGEFASFNIKIKGKEIKYEVIKSDKLNFSFTNFHTAGSIFLATTEMKTCLNKLQEE